MKKLFIIICILCVGFYLAAQDSTHVKKPIKPRHLKTWRISEMLAVPDSIPADTVYLNFQDRNPIDTFSIANSYNGNLGSPLQSKLYFKRPQGSDFLFDDAYRPYIMDINTATFYDVKFPFSNLTYYSGGITHRKEDQVKFTFSASPSKKMNFGTFLDYFYSVGSYDKQAARRFTGSVFGRYDGKHYSAYGFAAMNNLQNHENGGLSDLTVMIDPVGKKPKDWLTNINGYSTFEKNLVYYNHKYSIGFNRKVKVSEDSTALEYVPVTHFGHTIKYEEMRKRYYEPSVEKVFYDNTYTSQTLTNDTAAVRTLNNAFYINMDERFNKWMKFGLTGYIENEIQQFSYLTDTILTRSLKSNTRLGGVLSKTQGTNFTYNILGDIYLVGYKAGEFRLEGKAVGNFKIGNENILLSANAAIKNETPSFFLQFYNSNHFRWENNFGKIYRTSVGGLFSLPKRKTMLKLNVENVTNFIYFNELALPTQHNGNVQIISADLKQDFHFGKFSLENNVVYQLSSNNNVVPLPALSLYHNFYYQGTWFKVLQSQIGVNVRMHTKYFAPSFSPAIGQFFTQNDTKIGNYPIVNAYMNYHLKFARFFFEYYHINHWVMKGNYYSMPTYPLNPTVFKMGLSWNFFN